MFVSLILLRSSRKISVSLSKKSLRACAGFFLSMMLQFDHHNNSGHTYFYSACGGYVVGLGTTIWVMNTFNAAQPALLYIVPAVLGAVLICALVRGELTRWWTYKHGDQKEAAPGGTGESEAGGVEVKKDQ